MTERYRSIPEDEIRPAPIKQVIPVNAAYPTVIQLSSGEQFGGQEDTNVVVGDQSVEIRYAGGIVVSFPAGDYVVTPGHRFESEPSLRIRDYPGEIIGTAAIAAGGAVAAITAIESSNGQLHYTGLSLFIIGTVGLINQLRRRSFR